MNPFRNRVNVRPHGVRRVVTALKFVEHQLAKMSHRGILLVTTRYARLPPTPPTPQHPPRQRLSSNALIVSDSSLTRSRHIGTDPVTMSALTIWRESTKCR